MVNKNVYKGEEINKILEMIPNQSDKKRGFSFLGGKEYNDYE